MISATIQTELDNLQFAPGEEIRGRVAWQAGAEVTNAELRLFYYTAGKGTRDATVVETRAWTSSGPSGEQAFSFTLPDGPYSLSGKLVSLIWALELVLDPVDHSERLEITVSPTGHEIDLYRYPLPPGVEAKVSRKAEFSIRKT